MLNQYETFVEFTNGNLSRKFVEHGTFFTVANMFLTVPSSSDTREHFRKLDWHCSQLFSFFQLQRSHSNHRRHVSSLVSNCIANLNLRDMAKQLLNPLRLIAHMNFSLKNYSCELVNLTGTVGNIELIPTSTTVACESRNVNDKLIHLG